MRRGEVWWADLGVPRGSQPGFERPVVIVSSDVYNRSRIATVLCAVITSNIRLADAPGNVMLTEEESGLERPSVVNVSQVVTLDKVVLRDHLATLTGARMRRVDQGLRQVLDL